jgi:hypothetical protein
MSQFFDDQRDDGDADVRAALRQAVAGVQPEGGLERIEERLGEQARGSGLKVVIGTIAAVLATALVIGGVSWLNHEAKKPKPAPSSGRDVTVHAYYLGPTAGGLRLFSEQRTLHDVRTSDLQAAVSAALGTPEDPDYKPFPGSPQATVSSEGDVVVVDFNQPSLASYPLLSDLDAGMAIQALVWTVNDTVQRPVQVRFEINGQPARSLFGKVLNGSVTEQAADTVLSPVSVDLSEGQQVPSGTTVLGKASTFEANVVWELRQGEQVVKQGYTTAGECCTLSPYAFRLEAPPGSYTLVVHDTDESGGEGNGVTSDSKDIVVTPSAEH